LKELTVALYNNVDEARNDFAKFVKTLYDKASKDFDKLAEALLAAVPDCDKVFSALGKLNPKLSKINVVLPSGAKIVEVFKDGVQNLRQTLETDGRKIEEAFDQLGSLVRKTIVNSAGIKLLEAAYQNGLRTLENIRDAAGKLVSEYWRDSVKEVLN